MWSLMRSSNASSFIPSFLVECVLDTILEVVYSFKLRVEVQGIESHQAT
jgi:hypothetical protein